MSAFLSHSSKDKHFVGQVASILGDLNVEYDERTFDFVLNVSAIRMAMKRVSIIVFFVSQNSYSSSFVAEEQRQALEALGRGSIKRVLIFCIDDSSFRQLPDWMQEINIVQKVSNFKVCARRIQSALVQIDAAEPLDNLYIGRDIEEASLRRALAVTPAKTPIFLHASGFHGVGRRTFLRNSLKRIMPRYFDAFVQITAPTYGGVENLYRSLYELQVVSSKREAIDAYANFALIEPSEQIRIVVQMILELTEDGSFLVVIDEYAVFDEEGDYQEYWAAILRALKDVSRPIIGFVQNRVQPYVVRQRHDRCFHIRINELSESDSKELIALALRESNIDFTDKQLKELSDLVDGHPFNLRFVVGYAKHYGLTEFLASPREFIEWKNRKGEEFLSNIEFTEIESEIISSLADYRYLSPELLFEIVSAETDQIMEAIRALQDYCCIELRNGFLHLASPIREATRRDERFVRDENWRLKIANIICDVVNQYEEDDDIPLALLQTATVAQARGGAAPDYLRALLLPSHLIVIAREHYDKRYHQRCIEFCRKAFEWRNRMTPDAQVETLRLWGLSAARINDYDQFKEVVDLLGGFNYPTARRVRLFLEGFHARLNGRLDIAESRFKEAWALAPRNAHINRELADLYCRQKRYNEAEQYARSTYEIQSTNPYIIDVLLEILIGKHSSGQKADEKEIEKLSVDLEYYSRGQNVLLHDMREIQKSLSKKDYNGAASKVAIALSKNKTLAAIYFLGIDAELGRSNVNGAERYLKEVEGLLREQGQSEGYEARLFELKIEIYCEKGQYVIAKRLHDDARGLPPTFLQKVRASIARAIVHDGKGCSADLIDWANAALKSREH